MLLALFTLLTAYLVGTLPIAAAVGRRAGHDPLREGSGNPGATNVYRTAGRRAGAQVLLGDGLKGVLAAAMGLAVGGSTLALGCALAAVLGHVAPVQRRFRGGKGVATAAGAGLVVLPLVTVGLGVLWVVVVRVTRRASVGSLAVAAALPVVTAARGRPGAEVALSAAIAAVLVVRHAENVSRLRRGVELGLSAGG